MLDAACRCMLDPSTCVHPCLVGAAGGRMLSLWRVHHPTALTCAHPCCRWVDEDHLDQSAVALAERIIKVRVGL